MKYTVAILQKYYNNSGKVNFKIYNYTSIRDESKETAKSNAIKEASKESRSFTRYCMEIKDTESESHVMGIVAVYPIIEEKDIPTEIQNGDFEERMDYMYNLTVKEEEYADFIKYDKKKAFF
jgi:hypothetical protein